MFFYSTIALAQIEGVRAIAFDMVYPQLTAAEAEVCQSSGGWYTSAKKKELWNLEVLLQENLLFIPNKFKNFLFNKPILKIY